MKVLVLLFLVAAVSAVREPAKKTCDEPPESGRCLAYFPMYYYDAETGTCKEFIYGGCEGNGNRYGTENDCMENCAGTLMKRDTSDVCTLEKDSGPCYGYFPKYYYDHEAGECKKFIYGGCQGNGNNFYTLDDCLGTCKPAYEASLDRPDCDKAPDSGLCEAYMPRYYYDQEAGMCKEFIYGGCGGNRNNFLTESECYNKCGALRAPSACHLEKVTGPCRGFFQRFYYDDETKTCKQFVYGGCDGNANNFETEDDCLGFCSATQAALDRPDCDKAADAGLCDAYIPRYYYDQEAGMCKKFIYGGCGGNRNNFRTEFECYNKCGALSAPSRCHLKQETGPCRGAFQRFYYDDETNTCKPFIYGGCGGNDNNFETEGQCLDVCSA